MEAQLRLVLILLGVIAFALFAVRELRRSRATPNAGQGRDNLERGAAAITADGPSAREPKLRQRSDHRSLPVVEMPPPDITSAPVDDIVDEDDAPLPSIRVDRSGELLPEAAPSEGTLSPDLQSQSPANDLDRPAAETVADNPVVEPAQQPRIICDWPEEGNRRVLSLRLVRHDGAGIAGGDLRRALGREGFRHGPMSIFHRTDAEGRVLVSAADLRNPGAFEIEQMDVRKYAGVNLFSIVPLDGGADTNTAELCRCAMTLADELGGALEDSKGQRLDASDGESLACLLREPSRSLQ
ncbi:MAG: cell division protein ZipA C-terminal FtsZ-binding domain-containing protein [Steroidobacteraceae bacterium]